jgi:parallel beta-helix repeat protein
MALAAGQPARAATFTVTNLDDAGAGSLRQAIEDANAAAGADVIDFQAGLNGTIQLISGQLAITDSVDIQGPGAAVIAVSGNTSSRVFYLYNGSALLDVTISGLTVRDGSATIGAGIVDFDENLVLDGVTLAQNAATADGGGLWADGFNFSMTVRNSTITGNTADGAGGGIYVEDTGGPLLIQNTVISGNLSGQNGGGIYFYDPDNDTTIENSTISGNIAGGVGGGIYFYDTDGGTHTIRGTTISGNTAASGGGLFLYGPDNPFVIENSTISGNQATSGDGGGAFFYNLYNVGVSMTIRHTTIAGNSATGSGGGLFTVVGDVTVENTIVGDNTATVDNDLCGPDGVYDLRFSLVESPGGANINDNGGNIFNQDPQLGPLQNNGGPTETHLPAATSPVVDAGDPAFAPPPSTDQRGFPRVVNGRLDMGAVERASAGTIQLAVSAASISEAGVTITITATRTGGTEGAVSVSFATSDGTAVAPADYGAAAGTLSWAAGDGAPKTFQVTIVNDTQDELDETFNATISNPQGGAALGAITNEVVTILDDDVPLLAIPTLGEYGKILFAALCGLGGFLLLRRRKSLAAPMLAVSLTLGGVGAAQAGPQAETRAATLAHIETQGNAVVIRLADGTTYRVSREEFKLVDGRKGHGGKGVDRFHLKALPAGQPVFLKVRHGRSGEVKRVRVELVDTAAKAQALARAAKQ